MLKQHLFSHILSVVKPVTGSACTKLGFGINLSWDSCQESEERSVFQLMWLWILDKKLVGRLCCCSKGGGYQLCGVACSFTFQAGNWI